MMVQPTNPTMHYLGVANRFTVEVAGPGPLPAAQQAFVEWWDETVGIDQSPGRGKTNAGENCFSVTKAEADTGISKQQVSRWRTHLKNAAVGSWSGTQAEANRERAGAFSTGSGAMMGGGGRVSTRGR